MHENGVNGEQIQENTTKEYLNLLDEVKNSKIEAEKVILNNEIQEKKLETLTNLWDKRRNIENFKEIFSRLQHNKEEIKTLEEIFGFSMEVAWEEDTDVLGIQIKFSDTQKAMIVYKKQEGLFSLVDMVPKHQNFNKIRDFLHETQDTAGFLAHMNQYFTKNSK